MKKMMMFLLLPFLFAGCAGSKESGIVIEVPDDRMPVKVIYGRRWIYGANYESEDPEVINAVVSALEKITVGSESKGMTTDYTDLVFLYYEDGSTKTYEFEDQCIVIEGKRYYVSSGLKELRNVLYFMADVDDSQ